jgi:N-glycosylase/DNA lyase
LKVDFVDGNIIVTDVECFSLALSLDCGQAFRWRQNAGVWRGVVRDKELFVSQEKEKLIFYNLKKEDLPFWIKYFDLERDYRGILDTLMCDESLNTACREYYGIRILRQEPWEALCSFIISSNNNIPRIKGIIERLCRLFGNRISEEAWAFPTVKQLSHLSPEDLAPIRAGFRSKYIVDAVQKINKEEVSLERIKGLAYEDAKLELMKIKGVGEKVADCALLYGFNYLETFPKDVWVKRVLSELYPEGLPECVNGYKGIAQQYLFHWRRNRTN